MKAAAFEYLKARSIDEICALLATPERETRLIAGGQTLVPMMAMRLVRPELLVDINDISELTGIEETEASIVIGAGTRQAEAERSAVIREHLPLLAAALPWVGHQQTRNRGTVGGSLANADPSAEIPLAAVILDAEVTLRSQSGERQLPVADFLTAPMETAIDDSEMLTAVRFPKLHAEGARGVGFEEVNTRSSDFAILAATAEVCLDADGVCRHITCGLGAASPVPFRATAVEEMLTGAMLTEPAIAEATAVVAGRLDPSSDLHADAGYRRQLAPGLLARAVASARDRAVGVA